MDGKEKSGWMWMDWLIFSLRCGWYGTGLTYYYVYSENLGSLSYGAFAVMVSLGFFVPLLFWRPSYSNPTLYLIAELFVSGGFSIYINNFLGINLSSSIILMPILMAGYLLTKRNAWWAIPVFVLLLPGNRFWTIENSFSFFLQYVDVFLFFGIGLGFNVITKSQKRYKLLLAENLQQYEQIQQQNKALEQYASQVEKYTLLEERNRMARDLHDSIGHYFTSITTGLDAVSYMIKVNPEMAEEKVTRLAEVARGGLTEVRQTIHQIAPSEDEITFSEQLKKMVFEFGDHTLTKMELDVTGEERGLAPHVKLTLIRFVQESLTNAKRHGEATCIKVKLHFERDSIQLQVWNNGKKIDKVDFGFGLTSMKNRLEELNGLLRIENEGEGVTFICTLPVGGFHETNQALTRG